VFERLWEQIGCRAVITDCQQLLVAEHGLERRRDAILQRFLQLNAPT
jgi:hypothetical protein